MLVEFLKQPISPNLNTTIGLLCLDLSGYQVRYVEWNLYSKGDGHCGDQQTNFGADLHSYVRSVDKIWQDIPSDGKKVHCHDSHPGCSGTWNQRVRITQLLSKEYTLTTAQLVRRGAAMYTELDSCLQDARLLREAAMDAVRGAEFHDFSQSDSDSAVCLSSAAVPRVHACVLA